MRVTSDKECYCHTCARRFHYLGIARHRAMHRDRGEACTIRFSDGNVRTWRYDLSREERETLALARAKQDAE